MISRPARAARMFSKGAACSQAILSIYGEEFGLLDRETALRIAAPFVGGLREGQTCGSVIGALMVLGLKYSPEKCEKISKCDDLYARVKDFCARFAARTGSCTCKDLLGRDISTPEGLKEAEKLGLFRTHCPMMVRTAGDILEEMLQEE